VLFLLTSPSIIILWIEDGTSEEIRHELLRPREPQFYHKRSTALNVRVHEIILIQIVYKNSVRTSQETHYVSATETNRLMLFGETIAVYCENHTEHVNTLCGQNAETLYIRIQFVPHRKHITSPLQRPTG
jgi:hypothetical protein